jgi:hypothetical protein
MSSKENTGLQTENFPAKCLSSKSKEMHGSCKDTNVEHGENVTVIDCYCPIYPILPVVTFKGLRVLESHMQNLSVEATRRMTRVRLTNETVFLEGVQHFQRHSASSKCLLILN